MADIIELLLPPEVAFTQELLFEHLEQRLGGKAGVDFYFKVRKRAVDARRRPPQVLVRVEVFDAAEGAQDEVWELGRLKEVSNAPEVVIVGAGPAGLFAALELIELGVKPIIVERGKDVRSRRRDLAAINKDHVVNPESNYCFGEGGAGTYSDGKLYTRSKKRGDVKRVLEQLVAHGAKEEILYDARPHIGTNKLPRLIQAMREQIIACGGQVLFDAKVVKFILSNGTIEGIVLSDGRVLKGLAVILATGHSARDIFEMLAREGIALEAKPFALGVRVEHPQQLIDKMQYRCDDRGLYLPAAPYSLTQQIPFAGANVGVFSFCMCPGGFIVPAATAPGEVVVNGMSPSKRNSKYANSGIVVSVGLEDFIGHQSEGALAGLKFQAEIERKAWEFGGQTQCAPAQRVGDFIAGKVSTSLLDTSYQPGLVSSDLQQVLPKKVATVLREGFKAFGKKMRGFASNEGQIVGVESRTSSPVKIPRDAETLEHPQIAGLFPCGEGAGYAGGIVSAALDGQSCARAVLSILNKGI